MITTLYIQDSLEIGFGDTPDRYSEGGIVASSRFVFRSVARGQIGVRFWSGRFDPFTRRSLYSELVVIAKQRVYWPGGNGRQMDPRYPIGKYTPPQGVTPTLRQEAISAIAEAPAKLRAAIRGLNEEQLNTPYREGGWTVRQVAHHVPDSHLNAYVRLRLALTEEKPTIKPYDEDAWSKLADSKTTPIEVSLSLLTAVHDRFDRI